MKRVCLALLAIVSSQAADAIYPRTPDDVTAATIVIKGQLTGAPGAGEVRIGGGSMSANASVHAKGFGLNASGNAINDYRVLARTSDNAIMLRPYCANEGGNGNLTLASADNDGIYECFTIKGGSAPFGIFLGTDPGSSPANQVRIGGGVIRANVLVATAGVLVTNKGLSISSDQTMVQLLTGSTFGAEIRAKNSASNVDRWLEFGSRDNNGMYTRHTRYDPNYGQWSFTGTDSGAIPVASEVFIGGGQIRTGGNARIGGTVFAREIKVQVNPFADYVFADGYRLRPLAEVEALIKRDRHLPGVPAAAVFEKDGLPVAEMMVKQMEKIEELTLYAIETSKRNQELANMAEVLGKKTDALSLENQQLKDRLATIEQILKIAAHKE